MRIAYMHRAQAERRGGNALRRSGISARSHGGMGDPEGRRRCDRARSDCSPRSWTVHHGLAKLQHEQRARTSAGFMLSMRRRRELWLRRQGVPGSCSRGDWRSVTPTRATNSREWTSRPEFAGLVPPRAQRSTALSRSIHSRSCRSSSGPFWLSSRSDAASCSTSVQSASSSTSMPSSAGSIR